MNVLARLERKALAIDDIYDPDYEQEQLTVIIEPRYSAMLNAVAELLKVRFPDVEAFVVDDAATRRLLAEAGQQIVRIDETTRTAIAEQLQLGQERGYSAWEIANGVKKDGYRGIEGLFKETWASRADTVARTELQNAQLQSAQDRYRAGRVVDRMKIVDGDKDDPCAARNGEVVPVTTRVDLQHPNCTVAVIPLLRGE